MSLLNIKFKSFRSFLTVLAVVIGVGSVYLLISFGLGLQNLVQNEVIGNKSIDTVDINPAKSSIAVLSKDNVDRIAAIPHVTSTSNIYMFAGQIKLDGSSVDLVTYGVDPSYLDLTNLTILSGSNLHTNKDDEIIINKSLLEATGIGDVASAIGKEVEINLSPTGGKAIDKKMRIVGVVDSGAGSEIFVPQLVFQEAEVPNFTLSKAVIDNRDSITGVRASIESLGFQTSSPVDTLDQINQVFKILNILLIGLGSTGMVIAILGMVNTLTVSLLERTKEIALMIAIGARPRDMKRLVMVEAIILSLAGGIIGVVSASALGYVINLTLNQMALGRGNTESFNVFYTAPWLIIATLLFMVLVGVVVSFVPARRAARINPIKALHQE